MSASDNTSGLSHYNVRNKFSHEPTASANLSPTAYSTVQTSSPYQTYRTELEDIKPLIFQSPTQTPNFGHDPLPISSTENFVQNSMSAPVGNQHSGSFQTTSKPTAIKVEDFIDSASCITSISSSKLTQFHSLNLQSPPLCKFQVGSSDELDYTSRNSSNFDPQSDVGSSFPITNTKDPSIISKTDYFVQNSERQSQDCLTDTKTSLLENVDCPPNNWAAKKNLLSSVQNQFSAPNLSLPPTYQMTEYTIPPDNLYSGSYISTNFQSQSKQNEMPILETEEQQTNGMSKFQGFNYSIDDGNNTVDPKNGSLHMSNSAKEFVNIIHSHLQSIEKNFVCPHCQKIFQYKSSLREHVKLHMDERPQYICHVPECARIFNQKGNLKKHLYGYEDTPFCLSCNQKILCKGIFAAHSRCNVITRIDNNAKGKEDKYENFKSQYSRKSKIQANDDRNGSNDNRPSASPLKSMVQTTSTSNTYSELSDKACILSSSEIRSDKKLFTLPAPSKQIIENKSRFDSQYGTMRTSQDTCKAQSCGRHSLPTMHLPTALSSLNDTFLLGAEKPPKLQWTRCECPNCSAYGGNKTKDANGKLQHVCHYPDCRKVFDNTDHLKRHLKEHSSKNTST